MIPPWNKVKWGAWGAENWGIICPHQILPSKTMFKNNHSYTVWSSASARSARHQLTSPWRRGTSVRMILMMIQVCPRAGCGESSVLRCPSSWPSLHSSVLLVSWSHTAAKLPTAWISPWLLNYATFVDLLQSKRKQVVWIIYVKKKK